MFVSISNAHLLVFKHENLTIDVLLLEKVQPCYCFENYKHDFPILKTHFSKRLPPPTEMFKGNNLWNPQFWH